MSSHNPLLHKTVAVSIRCVCSGLLTEQRKEIYRLTHTHMQSQTQCVYEEEILDQPCHFMWVLWVKFSNVCVCYTSKDRAELHWCLIGVHSDLKLGGLGGRGRNTHQRQRKPEPGLENFGNSWEKRKTCIKIKSDFKTEVFSSQISAFLFGCQPVS